MTIVCLRVHGNTINSHVSQMSHKRPAQERLHTHLRQPITIVGHTQSLELRSAVHHWQQQKKDRQPHKHVILILVVMTIKGLKTSLNPFVAFVTLICKHIAKI